jgi:hypothetical protein
VLLRYFPLDSVRFAFGAAVMELSSTDCGFGTFAEREFVAEEVVWRKLAAAAEGARTASDALWARRATDWPGSTAPASLIATRVPDAVLDS